MFQKIASIPFVFRLFVQLLVIGLIAGSYYFFFYVPQEEKFEQLGQEYDSIINSINDIRPYTLAYDEFKKQLDMVEEQYSIVLSALPDEKGYYALYDETVGLAEKDGVKVNLFQPGGEKRIDSFYSSVDFSIRMETPYQNLVRFIYDLNYLDKIINLQNMNISVIQNKSGLKTLDVSANLNSYRFSSGEIQAAKNRQGGGK